MGEKVIESKLEKSAALVLFEFLTRILDERSGNFLLGEENVLTSMVANLESQLTELFAPNYKDLVEEARRRVVEESK